MSENMPQSSATVAGERNAKLGGLSPLLTQEQIDAQDELSDFGVTHADELARLDAEARA